MKYYKGGDGEVFAFEEDGSQDAYIKDDMTLLSDEELAAIRASQAEAAAPTLEQLKEEASAQRDNLLALAGLRIAPLQDAADLEDASDEEMANLKLWKQYRIAVNRTSSQPGYPQDIQWPEQPR